MSLGAGRVTLAWTHSVEKTEWQEDWLATPRGLVLEEARVKGSGAGMEPPPEAKLVDGFWRWRPALAPQERVLLRRSGATADSRVCADGRCRPMDQMVPTGADPIVMTTCPGG